METPRERILKAINHSQPDRTPVETLGFQPIERWLQHFQVKDVFDLNEKLGLDLAIVGRSANRWTVYTGRYTQDKLSIWGTRRNTGGPKGIGYSKERGDHPLFKAESVKDIECFAWPTPNDFDYKITGEPPQTIPDKARRIGLYGMYPESGKTHEESTEGGFWIPLLCILYELFGFEETLMKIYTEPKIIEAAISHLEPFLLEYSRRILEATKGLVDIFWFGDDFATARGMMISPEHWRKFFKPTYRKIFDLAKSYDLKIWFHCCGQFRPVMRDLIDMGMDVWETCQVHLPGNEPEVLKREYGKDICFFGAINSQHTLPRGTPDDVRAEVRERVRVLGKEGGYICGPDHTILPDVPIENVLAMLDEAKKAQP